MTSKRQTKSASTKASPRLYWLTYSSTKPIKIDKHDEYQHPKLFHERDGAAFIELAHVPLLKSYSYEEFIHLYPGHKSPLEAFPKFHSGDLLVLTTRPPLTDSKWFAKVDPETKVRKSIFQSECALEKILFNEMRKYFTSCLRTGLKLSDQAASLVSKDEHKWREVEFKEYGARDRHSVPSAVQTHVIATGWKLQPDPPPYTVAFLIRANKLPELGCDLIVSFGMDGYGTLIWNRIVRKRFPQLLATPRFVMAKLVFNEPIPERPITPAFADDERNVAVEILADGIVET